MSSPLLPEKREKQVLKIAFFGIDKGFDYFHIGGTESVVRRLAHGLLEFGARIDYIHYGSPENRELEINDRLRLRYFKSIGEAFEAISGRYNHVITIYLFPSDRLKYAGFRRRNSTSTFFHFIFFGWPDSWVKRSLYFSEQRFFPYNGNLYCISRRQFEHVRKRSENAVYTLPPVTKNYFRVASDKSLKGKIKITFLGRIDPGKGIEDVIAIFNSIKQDERFQCQIYGIHRSDHRESVKIHERLKEQNEIDYIEVDKHNYSAYVDDMVVDVLRQADIFIQPYRRLSSTIDTPLLILEAMASLCPVVTKPFGNIPDICGDSKFILREDHFIPCAIELLQRMTWEQIIRERERIFVRNSKLNFESSKVAETFIALLRSNKNK